MAYSRTGELRVRLLAKTRFHRPCRCESKQTAPHTNTKPKKKKKKPDVEIELGDMGSSSPKMQAFYDEVQKVRDQMSRIRQNITDLRREYDEQAYAGGGLELSLSLS